jgi:hypothetical protein
MPILSQRGFNILFVLWPLLIALELITLFVFASSFYSDLANFIYASQYVIFKCLVIAAVIEAVFHQLGHYILVKLTAAVLPFDHPSNQSWQKTAAHIGGPIGDFTAALLFTVIYFCMPDVPALKMVLSNVVFICLMVMTGNIIFSQNGLFWVRRGKFEIITKYLSELLADHISGRSSAGSRKQEVRSIRNPAPNPQFPIPNYNGPVVVIGGSSGGFEAMNYILSGLPADHPPIVFCEHLRSRDLWDNWAEEIKKSYSGEIVEDYFGLRSRLVPGMVVVTNKAEFITDDEGVSVITYYEDEEVLPINTSILSAVKVLGNKVICIILSGCGEDGALGAKEVFSKSGVVIAQKMDPQGDKDKASMPNKTVASVPGAKVLGADIIADAIMDISRNMAGEENTDVEREQNNDAHFQGEVDGVLVFWSIKPVGETGGQFEFIHFSGSDGIRFNVAISRGDLPILWSHLALEALLRVVREDDVFCDLGCGQGVICAGMRNRVASIYASDIDPECIDDTAKTLAVNNMEVDLRCGDLFEPFGDARFDLIGFNPPADRKDVAERAILEIGIASCRERV